MADTTGNEMQTLKGLQHPKTPEQLDQAVNTFHALGMEGTSADKTMATQIQTQLTDYINHMTPSEQRSFTDKFDATFDVPLQPGINPGGIGIFPAEMGRGRSLDEHKPGTNEVTAIDFNPPGLATLLGTHQSLHIPIKPES